MPQDEEFLKRLRAAFLEEGGEILAEISKRLADLENTADFPEQVTLLGKVAAQLHSLKGSARAVNEDDLVGICQGLETVFLHLKKTDQDNLPRHLLVAQPVLFEIVDTMNEFFDTQAGITSEGLTPVEKSGLKAAVDIKLSMLNHRLGKSEAQVPEPPAKPVSKPVQEVRQTSEQMQTGTFNVTELRAMMLPLESETGERAKNAAAKTNPARGDGNETVRVPVDRLDRLLTESEELLLLKGQMQDRLGLISNLRLLLEDMAREKQSQPAGAELKEARRQVNQIYRLLLKDTSNASHMLTRFLDTAKNLTMQPMNSTLEVFPRLVRDLARELRKEAELQIDGGHLEIDRRILEKIKDPLTHVLRNALDHGIESPEAREQSGKPRKARLKLAVKQLSVENLEITLEDDGAGVNAERVKAKAVEKGLISQEEARNLSYGQALGLIFRPDFSTRDEVSELSGRGLGLAIVKEKIEELSGRLEIVSTEGSGTTFKIVLPTKLAAFSGIKVQSQGQFFVIPVAGLVRAMRVHPLAMEITGGRRTFFVDGKLIPVATLANTLSIPEKDTGAERSTHFRYLELLVLQSREKTAGLIVDQVLDQGEFLVKKLAFPIENLPNFSGATILSSGEPVLVLNTHEVVEAVHAIKVDGNSMLSNLLDNLSGAEEPQGLALVTSKMNPTTILVVEDSITSRILLKNIFESAGYIVKMAVDGQEGLKQMRHMRPDLVVCDVEMPVLDGLGMVKAMREDQQLKDLPVILVTSLASETDRKQGLNAGANAYFIKGDLDQVGLLETVKRLT